jgi:DNA repair exonuclease SbcCD ATPase subunit
MGRKHRSVPREAGESGEVKQLKDKIKRLSSDKRRLISEVTTLTAALDKTREYIDDKLKGVSVEKVIKSVKEERKLKEINKENEELSEKCRVCNRPLQTLSSTMVRSIFFCTTCRKRDIVYDADLNEIDSIEALD